MKMMRTSWLLILVGFIKSTTQSTNTKCGKSCELANSGSLLVGFRNEIEKGPLEDFSRTNFTNIHKFNRTIQAIDYFYKDHKLFMMTCDERLVCPDGKLVVKEDGKPSKIIHENVSNSLNLAVDWIGGNIFFSEIVDTVSNYILIHRVSVCTMDGKFCREIMEKKENAFDFAFTIHPMRGLLFYTEYTKDVGRIMMAAMDGSQQQVLIELDYSTIIMPMTIDFLNHDLYFGDLAHHNIKRVNIDTKKTTIIVSQIPAPLPDNMVYHNGFLYSIEFDAHVQVLDVTTKNASFSVNDSRHQLEPSQNPCQELNCPEICVIVPGFTAKCLSTNTTPCDLSKEFDCGDGTCLPKAWQCDNIKDCRNGADEYCEPVKCQVEDFYCWDCVQGKYKCDGIPDCRDGSDEKYCEYNSRRFNVPAPFNFGDSSLYSHDGGLDKNGCLPGFGYCSTQKVCIPNQSFCDGKHDCNDEEDERNCTLLMKHSENPCKNEFVCKTNETYKDKKCIRMNELCNGKKECPLGDDESEKCSECSTKHCQHNCKNTPTGAKCECNKGYRLNSDGFSCVDVDECTLPERACHHFCENKNGSYRCSCAKGYHLQADEKSCDITHPSKGTLLFGLRHEIKEKPLEELSGSNFTSVHKFNQSIQAFDYFHRDRKLFMMTCGEDLYCHDEKLVVKEDGKPSKVLRKNVSKSMNLAVDWIGGNIFFTEEFSEKNNNYSPVAKISVCTMDGKFCRGLIETKEPSSFFTFAIHPMRGLLFYTEYTNNVGRIMMAAMDGSQKQVLIKTNSRIMVPLTIDYLNHDLYFGDAAHAYMKRVNIDTKKTAIIASKLQFSPTDSMAYHNGFLYSTERYKHLQVLDVTRENARAHILPPIDAFDGFYTPRMAVNDSSYQLEPSHNPCQEMDCPWICVIVPGFTAKCLCPNGYTPSMLDTTCIPPSIKTDEQDNLTHIGSESTKY